MHRALEVANVRFRPALDADRARGLLGWASFELGGLRVDGTQIRRTRAGHVSMYWPERMAGTRRHPIVQPVDRDVRLAIEREVIAELHARGVVS